MECNQFNLECDKSLKKKLWRFRLNWLFLFVLGGLYAVSYTSISSSFHQFVTNPSAIDLNGTNSTMEQGLGQTESFYSLLISAFNLGALVGAVFCGFLVKFFPYWHLLLFSLLSHTLGYVLYAVTYISWLIMISKFLSGFFIGAELTLALSYIAVSSIEYENLRSEMGLKSGSSSMLRNMLFALHNIGINIGYIFGPGFAVIFAQFEVDQFRSIAWYNVALGIVCIVLQLVMFHGESSCSKLSRESKFCSSKLSWEDLRIAPYEALILIFLVVLRGVLSFRFGAYETVYNPVLGDYFGFNERDSSYFFFGLTVAQIAGTLLLIALQLLKLNSQIIAIIGLSMTLISFTIMADWQAIPYDQCTEYSPFHHPEFVDNYTLPRKYHSRQKRATCLNHFSRSLLPDALMEFYITPTSTLVLSSGQTVSLPLTRDIRFTCHSSNECNICGKEIKFVNSLVCLKFFVKSDSHGCAVVLEDINPQDGQLFSQSFLCSADISTFSVCAKIYEVSQDVEHQELPVHTQTLQQIESSNYNNAMRNCIQANTTHDDCYWNPYSIITKKHCEDCQPICRSRSHSLSFIQFLLGAGLLLISIPVAWVPVAALISSRVPTASQGIVMGFMGALSAIGRSISPLWCEFLPALLYYTYQNMDAAYEGMQKRTFLAMILLIATHLPFLIGIIVLYKRLNIPPILPTSNGYSQTSNSSSEESDDDVVD